MVARIPTTMMPARITQMISISEARWRKISLYTFRANIDEADNTEESADDITAADTAPKPKNETKSGVKYCNTIGKIMLVSCSVSGHGPVYAVSFQAKQENNLKSIFVLRNIFNLPVDLAIAPIRTGGIAIIMQPKAAT